MNRPLFIFAIVGCLVTLVVWKFCCVPSSSLELQPAPLVLTWTIIRRGSNIPTAMKTISGAATQPATAVYDYQMLQDINGHQSNYLNQTVLETFGQVTAAGFTMADITQVWKDANPTFKTPDAIAAKLWDSGGNGTFVINGKDEIYDQHSGFGGHSEVFTPAAVAGGRSGYNLPQVYKCAGNAVGSYNIKRIYVSQNVTNITKTGP